VCVRDSRLAHQMEQAFLADMRACRPVELEAWRKRGLLAKALEAVASLLEFQV